MTAQRILPFFTVLFLFFALTNLSHAALIFSQPVAGEFVVFDDDTNLMWLQDANYAMTSGYDSDGYMRWADAGTWADDLVFAGYDDWRLPSSLNSDGSSPCAGYNCTDSEMGHLYYNEGITSSSPFFFTNVQPYTYWSGTEYAPYYPDNAWYFNFDDGNQDIIIPHQINFRYAWAVRDVAVPEPTSLLLLGSGLVGIVALKRRKK